LVTRYSIPLPKGGRHSTDIILCEDQLLRNRKPKAKADDAFDAAAAGFGAVGVSHSENARYARFILCVNFKLDRTFVVMDTEGATQMSAGRSCDETTSVLLQAALHSEVAAKSTTSEL
jgi:hypothetical protein